MTPIDLTRAAVACLLTGVLVWAAISDIRSRRIPNQAVLAVIALFLPWAILNNLGWTLWALAAAAVAFVGSFVLYATKIVGAGDSKLYAATALFAGMNHLWLLTVVTALAGGVIALVSVAARPNRALVMFTMRGKGDFGRGVPYGVAIAAGAILVVWGVLLKLPWPAFA